MQLFSTWKFKDISFILVSKYMLHIEITWFNWLCFYLSLFISKELMLSSCGAREDSWESLGQQTVQTSPVLKKINPEYSLEGLMLNQKLQYFGHLIQTTDSLENTLSWERLKAEEDRGWDVWMASPIQWTWTWANPRRWGGTRKPGMLQCMELLRVGHDLETEEQQYPGYM